MTTKQIRALGYTNSLQQLVWTGNNNTRVTAYLWGGGGGGGGNDRGIGGAGGGGGFTQYSFTISNGDVLVVAVGGAGGAGGSGASGAAGGRGGSSYYVVGGAGYYGGVGGIAGASGSSGGGGGGGGATVLLLNGQVVAAAAGGGGGGGAGVSSNGGSAPGPQGQSGTATVGGDGVLKIGDGGGGGGGGGGILGGLGGNTNAGDSGANAGAPGLSSDPGANPSGRNPGGRDNQYYIGSPGVGGGSASNGNTGYASFEFFVTGTYVHHEGYFQGVSTFAKFNNEWNPVQAVWAKTNGIWQPIIGAEAPLFTKIPNDFGGPGTTCISVCDESSPSWSSNRNSWDAFMSRRPGTPFYLLGPGTSSRDRLKVPAAFVPENLGYGPFNVARDNGNPAARSDWFAIANLASSPPGATVELSIDTSGSMKLSTVRASYDYFIEQCKAAGITVVGRRMKDEKWVAPFL
jgi:hypothetical protein